MALYAQRYYQQLYTPNSTVECNVDSERDTLASTPIVVTEDHNRELERPITAEEITAATKSLPRSKAPRLDKVPTEFFQECWREIGPDMVELIKEVLSQETLPNKFNTSNVVLIPKSGDLSLITNYHLISILSTIYKIIAKALANRLVPHLPRWIQKS